MVRSLSQRPHLSSLHPFWGRVLTYSSCMIHVCQTKFIFQHSSRPHVAEKAHTGSVSMQTSQFTGACILQMISLSGQSVQPFQSFRKCSHLSERKLQSFCCFWTSYLEENWGELVSWDDFLQVGVPERTSLMEGQL